VLVLLVFLLLLALLVLGFSLLCLLLGFVHAVPDFLLCTWLLGEVSLGVRAEYGK
jgi:hypothetical protein